MSPRVVPPPVAASPLSILDAFARGPRWIFHRPKFAFAALALVFLVVVLFAGTSLVPGAAFATVPLALLVAGPFCGALSHLTLRAWRGETPRLRELPREGWSRFGALFLAFAFVLGLTILAAIPGAGLVAFGLHAGGQVQDFTPSVAGWLAAGWFGGGALMLLPAAFYGFAPTLVLERGLGVGDALRLSRRTMALHPWRAVGFAGCCLVVILAGLLLAGLGFFVALPWVLGARAHVHDLSFGPRHAFAE
ncbi:MAG: hypothetical protein JNL97_15740 [Verrucomicrobiales bacterium]|nr:hypothetical protein [Verrucomicrobiales bacterium]